MSEFAKEQKRENRREVYKYIEVIVNTRMHGTGYPVQVKELLVLTKLPENTLKTTLKWLIRHGLVETVSPSGYLPNPIPAKGLCWMHGRYYEGYVGCPKCLHIRETKIKNAAEKLAKRERREIKHAPKSRVNGQSNPTYKRSRVAKAIRENRIYLNRSSGDIWALKQDDLGIREAE